jgi:hypothetical protein
MILVQQVGVFLMAMKTVCGQQLKVRPRIIQEVMMTQTKE